MVWTEPVRLVHHCVAVQSMRNLLAVSCNRLLGMLTNNSLLVVAADKVVGHRMEYRTDFVCGMFGPGRHLWVMNNRYYMMCRGHMKYRGHCNLCCCRIPLENIVSKRIAVVGSKSGFVKIGRP